MKILKVISILLMVLFTITLSISFIGSNVSQRILKPEGLTRVTMESLMSDEALPNRIRDGINFQSWYSAEGVPSEYKMMGNYIPDDKYVDLFNMIIPETERRDIVENTFQSVFHWLDNEETYPNLQLDFTPTLERVSENTLEIAKWTFNRALPLPPCSPEQKAKMDKGIYGTELMQLMSCLPPEEHIDTVTLLISTMMSGMIAEMDQPTKINATEEIQSQITEAEILTTKSQINQFRGILEYIWILPIILFSLALLLVVRCQKDLINWSKWPLFISGLIGFILAFYMQNPYDLLMTQMMPPPASIPEPAVVPILVNFLSNSMSIVGSSLIWQMGIVLGVGIVLMVYSYRLAFVRLWNFLKKLFEVKEEKLVKTAKH